RQRPVYRLGQTPDVQTFPRFARVPASEQLCRLNSDVNSPRPTVGESNRPHVLHIQLDATPVRTAIRRSKQAASITPGQHEVRIPRIVRESDHILARENGAL